MGKFDKVRFQTRTLVSNRPVYNPQFVDPQLQNAWDLEVETADRIWVTANRSANPAVGHVIVYKATGEKVVSFEVPGGPTGVTLNTAPVGTGGSDAVYVATEAGKIYGIRPATQVAVHLVVDNTPKNAFYTGLEMVGTRLYATDFFNGRVDVFTSSQGVFTQIYTLPFCDRQVPCDYAPFNIEALGPYLFVTYARKEIGTHHTVSGPGRGIITVFDLNGVIVSRLVKRDNGLNVPYGETVAPASFGKKFANKLLVGNYGDGTLAVYDGDGEFLGTLKTQDRQPLTIDGLGGLARVPGTGVGTGVVYFVAGPNDGADGLLGRIEVVPQPGPRR